MVGPVFHDFKSLLNKDVKTIRQSQLDQLRKSIPKIPSRWNPFTLQERARLITERTEQMRRINALAQEGENGLDELILLFENDRDHLLLDPDLILSIIKNRELSYGEKRNHIAQALYEQLKEIRQDPAIMDEIAKISPEEQGKLIVIMTDFIDAKTAEEKIKLVRERLPLLEDQRKLCLVGMGDIQFIRAALFEVPYETLPPPKIRHILLSLLVQKSDFHEDSPNPYKDIEREIKTSIYLTVPDKLKEWNDALTHLNPAMRALTPALKDLSKRLSQYTRVSFVERFKSIFSSRLRMEVATKDTLVKSISDIDKLRERLKQRTEDRAHFKNVKRNCATIVKHSRLGVLRLEYRKAAGKAIPIERLDQALRDLHKRSLKGVEDIIKDYGIENREALINLLVIRVVHFPDLAAALTLYYDEMDGDVKKILKEMNHARSEVLKTLMSYG